MDKTIPRLSFITGANDKYFFLCNILLQSLEEFFPGIPCFVMDFGFTESQVKFFERKNCLLKLPPHLKKTDHPYKLKSSLRTFLHEKTSAMLLWVDSDIIAVTAGTKQLFAIVDHLHDQRKTIAIAPDYGRPKAVTIGEHVEFGEPLPKFKLAVSNNPEILERIYFNSGLVFFSDHKVLEDWEAASSSLEGDWLWEQYALNLVCGRNPNEVMILDPHIWNVQGSLLRKISIHNDGVYCGEEKSIFAHATSVDEPGHNTIAVNQSISKNGYGCNTYMRLFQNSFLRMTQDRQLSNFLSANFALLKDLNILFNLNTRRNDLCPCGSGNRFKHCHGADL